MTNREAVDHIYNYDAYANPIPKYFTKYFKQYPNAQVIIAIRDYTNGVEDAAAIVLIHEDTFRQLNQSGMCEFRVDEDGYYGKINMDEIGIIRVARFRGTAQEVKFMREKFYASYRLVVYKPYDVDIII